MTERQAGGVIRGQVDAGWLLTCLDQMESWPVDDHQTYLAALEEIRRLVLRSS